MTDLIHPRLLSSLHRFYPSTCTIQAATVTRDAAGEEILTWANLAGHVAIPCTNAPTGGREIKAADMTYVIASHNINLAGNYPTAREKMRAIVGGLTYDILLVESDSHGETTRLACQIVR